MKRFICAVIFTVLVFALAACGGAAANSAGQPTTAPTSSTSRNQQPVKVNQTVANAEAVDAQSGQAVQATPSSSAAPVDTPATSDFPVMYLAGSLGLIFLCSAGLLMLRKI